MTRARGLGAAVLLVGCVGDSGVVTDAGPQDSTTEQSPPVDSGPDVEPADQEAGPMVDAGGDAAAACLSKLTENVGFVRCGNGGGCGSPTYGCCALQYTCPTPAQRPLYCDPADAGDASSPYLECSDNGACGAGQVCCLSAPVTLTNNTFCPRTATFPASSTATCTSGTSCGGNAMLCTSDGPACPGGQTCQRALLDNLANWEIGVCSP